MSENAEQAEFWNGRMGEAWVRVEDNIDRMLLPLTEPAMAHLAAQSGERIIDIGCGCGTTSTMIAGHGADVWGIDISDKMIAQANAKNSEVTFTVADAASQSFTPDHDAIFSRFGIMFFDDPLNAFKNLKSALKPQGRLVFLCWQVPTNNPWMGMVGQALQPYQPEDLPPPDPKAPGPFSLADPDRTKQLLTSAGMTNIDILPVEEEIFLGKDVDEAMVFQQYVGPLSALLAITDASKHEELIQVVRGVFEPLVSADGIKLPAAAWLVSAS